MVALRRLDAYLSISSRRSPWSTRSLSFLGQCVIEVPLDLGVRGLDEGLLAPDSFEQA
jgi:hypothetical protein